MRKTVKALIYPIPFFSTLAVLLAVSLLNAWSFPLFWLIFFFLIIPFSINLTARKLIPVRNKIKPILINLILFHGFVWFMTYKTDMGMAALISLPVNLVMLVIYDWVARGGPVKIRST